MKILIINLTRLGDIIQSLGLIKGLRQNYPSAELHFLAMSSFAGILKNIPELDQIHVLNDEILVEKVKEDFWLGYREITEKVAQLNAEKFDLLINPVISLQSSYLSFLINAGKKKGMSFTEIREQTVKSEWSSFLLANQHNLGDHAFNLVDIFAGVGDIRVRPTDYRLNASQEAKQKIEALWSEKNLLHKKCIGFHIGASQSNKAWEKEYFKSVILALLQRRDCEIILFGGYKETEIADFFGDIRSEHFHGFIGQFNLDELIAGIHRLNLLITNDTGPMHIGATGNIPILNISLGPVSMWETAPYCDHALILQADIECHPCNFDYQCPHWNCHHRIQPADVLAGVDYLMNHLPIPVNHHPVLYWQSTIDPFGMRHWVPVAKREIRPKELLFEWKRAIWALTLLKHLSPEHDWISDYADYLHRYYEIPRYDFSLLISDMQYYLGIITKIRQNLDQIAGIDLSQKKNLDKLKINWSNAQTAKNELFASAKSQSVIYDWFWFVTFSESQLDSRDFHVLSRQTILIYEQLSAQLQTMINCLFR